MEGLVAELLHLIEEPDTLSLRLNNVKDQGPSAEDLGAAISAATQFALACDKPTTQLRAFAEALVQSGSLTPDALITLIGNTERNALVPDSAAEVKKTERRLRTRHFFTQKQYNLHAEETEGYSKLLTILHAAENAEPAPGWVDEVLAVVSTFNLDINRAIEAVLNLGARRMTRERDPPTPNANTLGVRDIRLPPMVASLLNEFPPQHLTAVLGATLLRLQENASTETAQTLMTREATLLLTFVLVREGRMTIDKIWPYLDPSREVKKLFEAYESNMKAIAKRGNDIGKDANGRVKHQSNAASLRDCFSWEPDAENGPLYGVKSQAMDLLYLFIVRMRWTEAVSMIQAMSGDAGIIDVASHPPIAFALSNLAFAAIQPALAKEYSDIYEDCKIKSGEDGFLSFVSSSKELFGNGHGEKVREILFCLGPHARRSPPLLFALCRLMEGEPVNDAMKSIMKEVILPALSLTQSNASLANIIWSVLRRWEHPLRWELYGYLKHEVPLQCAASAVVGARASYEMRSIMKRLTVDNYRQYERTMAKITHGQALTVLSVMVRRTQGYAADKVTITPFVDSLKTCSLMSYDMLVYTLVDQLSDTTRERFKADGINMKGWFSATSLFLGVILRRLKIPSESMSGCLHFLFRKIVAEEDATLIAVLNQIILDVTDIDVERNLTSRQQDALSGGPAVRSTVQGHLEKLGDAGVPGTVIDFRAERDRVSAIQALKSAFFKTGMHCSISLGVAQLAARGSFDAENKRLPLKINGAIHDRARNALRQFSTMIRDMHLLESSRATPMDFWGPFREIGLTRMVKDLRILPHDGLSLMRPILKSNKNAASDSWHVDILPEDVRTKLAPELFRMFWTLSLGDLEVPEALYESEKARLRRAISSWENFLRSRRGDRKQMNRAESELGHFKKVLQSLESERKELIANSATLLSALRADKGSLCAEQSLDESAAVEFLQRCILPRALASAYDAMYCSKFVLQLLKLDVPVLNVPAFYSLIVKQAPVLLLSCTENDAANFGVLLREVLSTLEKWRCNKIQFEKEASKTPLYGFRKSGKSGRHSEPWRHEDFCEFLFELHQALTTGLCKLLRSNEYLHARNSLAMLHIVSDVYPKVKENAGQISDAVACVKKSEKDDLRLAATGVFSKLEKIFTVPEKMFKLKPANVKETPKPVATKAEAAPIKGSGETGRATRGVKRGSTNLAEPAERRSPVKRRGSGGSTPGPSGTPTPVETRRPSSSREAKRARTPDSVAPGANDDGGPSSKAAKRQRMEERPQGNMRRERPASGSGRDRGDRVERDTIDARDRNDRERRMGPGGNIGGPGSSGRNSGGVRNVPGWSGRVNRDDRQFDSNREPFRYPPQHHRRGGGYEPDGRNEFYDRGEDGRRGEDRRDRRGNEDHRGDEPRRGDGRREGDERRSGRGSGHSRRTGRNSGNRNGRKAR